MARSRVPLVLGLLVGSCLLCAATLYSRYIDWPSLDGVDAVRTYLPAEFPVRDAHHYTYRNFMDTWELYRFSTSPEAITFLADSLSLGSPAPVQEFPMIISRPPPYWWHPEQLSQAELYGGEQRAQDGHYYELLFSAETGIAYLIRFDG